MAKVNVINNNGTLNLRFSWQGKRPKLSLGLSDTRRNRVWAELKAKELELALVMPGFDLQEWRERLNPRRPQPTAVKNGPLSLIEIWDGYAEHRRPFVEETTYKTEYAYIRRIVSGLRTPEITNASKIRDELLERYTPDRCRRHLQQINAACRWAMEEGRIESNPFAELKIPSRRTQRSTYAQRAFTITERDAIIEAFYIDRFTSKYASTPASYYADAVAWGFNTGLRSEELWALRFEHCRGGEIHIVEALPAGRGIEKPKATKNRRERQLPLNAELEEILVKRQELLGGEGLLFPNRIGGYVDYRNFSERHWKRIVIALVEAGEVRRYQRPYSMRHTFASVAIAAGISVVQVAEWIGDSPETLLKHYAGTVGKQELPSRER